jgi:hypothetical protein
VDAITFIILSNILKDFNLNIMFCQNAEDPPGRNGLAESWADLTCGWPKLMFFFYKRLLFTAKGV